MVDTGQSPAGREPETWRLPSRLSPSRASEYEQCPRRFFYRAIAGLPDPATEHTLRGTLAHYCLEQLFTHDRNERTVATAQSYLDQAWDSTVSDEERYGHLLHLKDRLMVETGELVANYFAIEAPHNFDPWGQELRLTAEIAGVNVLGILDRIDRVERDGRVDYYITDYKTGKVPSGQYLDKAFFGMKVYAVLARAALGIVPVALRLVYLRGKSPAAAVRTLVVDERMLATTEAKLRQVWTSIEKSATTGVWPTRTGPLCNWCPFQDICPAHNPHLDGVEGIARPVPFTPRSADGDITPAPA